MRAGAFDLIGAVSLRPRAEKPVVKAAKTLPVRTASVATVAPAASTQEQATQAKAAKTQANIQTKTQTKTSAKTSASSAAKTSALKKPVVDPKVAALAAELRSLGGQHQGSKNQKVAELAKRALTAASSLQVQVGYGIGAAATGAVAAQAILKDLKAAVAEASAKDKTAATSAKAAADASRRVTQAQAKLKASAARAASAAGRLKAKAKGTKKKGPVSIRIAARGERVADKLQAGAAKLAAFASRKVAPRVLAPGAAGAAGAGAKKFASQAKRTHVGDDASDAAQQLQQAEQAFSDAQAAAKAVSDDLETSRRARDALAHDDPSWEQVQDDYTIALNAGMSLIFSDSALADAQLALNDMRELVAAIDGLPPPAPGSAPPLPPPPKPDPVGGVSVSPAEAQVDVGQKTRLAFQGASGAVLWSSSNSQVASVDQQGVVTGNQAGEANVTATQAGKLAAARVKVTGGGSVAVSPSSLQLAVGQPASALALSVNGQPPGAALGSVTWSSSNPAVATVDSAGSVAAAAPGAAVVTGSVGPYSAQAQVTVSDPNAAPADGGGWGGGGGGGSSGGGGSAPDDGGGYVEEPGPELMASEDEPQGEYAVVEEQVFEEVVEEPFEDLVEESGEGQDEGGVDEGDIEEADGKFDLLGAVGGSAAEEILQAASGFFGKKRSSKPAEQNTKQDGANVLNGAKPRASVKRQAIGTVLGIAGGIAGIGIVGALVGSIFKRSIA